VHVEFFKKTLLMKKLKA